MDKLIRIQQGESLPFEFSRGGDAIDGWECSLIVKQYPDDSPIVNRVIPAVGKAWPGFVTGSETTGLAVGLYMAIGLITNTTTDESEQVADGGVRFFVTKTWV